MESEATMDAPGGLEAAGLFKVDGRRGQDDEPKGGIGRRQIRLRCCFLYLFFFSFLLCLRNYNI